MKKQKLDPIELLKSSLPLTVEIKLKGSDIEIGKEKVPIERTVRLTVGEVEKDGKKCLAVILG